MESFSRILPLGKASFPEPLRSEILRSVPVVFEEGCSASYVIRTSHSYTHNPTRAAIAITRGNRLVVFAMGAKKIDVPLEDGRWLGGITITADKNDRVVFKVQPGVYGKGTQGDTLDIKVRTKNAVRLAERAAAAMARAVVPSSESASAQVQNQTHQPAPTPMSAPGAYYSGQSYMQQSAPPPQYTADYGQGPQEMSHNQPVQRPVEMPPDTRRFSQQRKPVPGQGQGQPPLI